MLDEETEDKSGVALETGEKAAVTFQNVCFSYEAGTPVIRDFTLAVPNGRKVALVGATGSGKTTIVNLLMRFYDASSRIRILGSATKARAMAKSWRCPWLIFAPEPVSTVS